MLRLLGTLLISYNDVRVLDDLILSKNLIEEEA